MLKLIRSWRVRIFFLACVPVAGLTSVWISCSSAHPSLEGLPHLPRARTDGPESIREYLMKGLAFTASELEVEAFLRVNTDDDRVIPLVVDTFRSTSDPGVRARCSFILGKSKSLEALGVLIEFVETPLPAEMNNETYTAYWSSLAAIGFTNSNDAIDFLGRLASDGYWTDRIAKESPDFKLEIGLRSVSGLESAQRLQADTIMALGSSGCDRAKVLLESFAADTDNTALLREHAVSALDECNRLLAIPTTTKEEQLLDYIVERGQ